MVHPTIENTTINYTATAATNPSKPGPEQSTAPPKTVSLEMGAKPSTDSSRSLRTIETKG